MKAYVFHGPGKAGWQDVPDPEVGRHGPLRHGRRP